MATTAARVTLQGTRPLLWHHFGPDAIPLEPREKTGKAGNDPEEWRRTVLRTAQDQLYVDQSYIFGCLRNGAKYTPRKRGTLQPLVAATLQVCEEQILIDRWLPTGGVDKFIQAQDQPVYLDVRSVRNPQTGGRNVRYRVAASSGWKTTFTLEWDNTVVNTNEMQGVIRDAGKFAGLGDGRGIGFGRFEVLEFQVLDVGSGRNAKKSTAKRSVAKNPTKGVGTRRT
jgi:hypothetical protein